MVLYQDGTFTDPLPSEVTVNTDDVLNVGVFLMDAKEGDDYRHVTQNFIIFVKGKKFYEPK